jgi:xylulose-5-phosphate/fructose-6-phosphate phosphoketolase
MRPDELFDANGRLIQQLKELAPAGTRRMSAVEVGFAAS